MSAATSSSVRPGRTNAGTRSAARARRRPASRSVSISHSSFTARLRSIIRSVVTSEGHGPGPSTSAGCACRQRPGQPVESRHRHPLALDAYPQRAARAERSTTALIHARPAPRSPRVPRSGRRLRARPPAPPCHSGNRRRAARLAAVHQQHAGRTVEGAEVTNVWRMRDDERVEADAPELGLKASQPGRPRGGCRDNHAVSLRQLPASGRGFRVSRRVWRIADRNPSRPGSAGSGAAAGGLCVGGRRAPTPQRGAVAPPPAGSGPIAIPFVEGRQARGWRRGSPAPPVRPARIPSAPRRPRPPPSAPARASLGPRRSPDGGEPGQAGRNRVLEPAAAPILLRQRGEGDGRRIDCRPGAGARRFAGTLRSSAGYFSAHRTGRGGLLAGVVCHRQHHDVRPSQPVGV